MLNKFKCLLLSFLFIFIIGCNNENNNVITQLNVDKNRYEHALEYQINENMIAKFPNYKIDNSNGILISKSEDMDIRLYHFVGIDELFSDEILSILLDNQITSMDDSGAIKFGFMVESMVMQITTENQIDINNYEKEWLSTELYDCFHLKNLTTIDGLCSDILFFHDKDNDGVIAFLFQYKEENGYLINDFIDAIEFTKEHKMTSSYKNELDLIYPSVIRLEVEVDEYGNVIK